MAKPRTVHRCRACEACFSRWSGRCGGCGAWNTLVETEQRTDHRPDAGMLLEPISLSAVDPERARPLPTGIAEVDRCLGGGLVPGSVTLIGGEPGVGKSTLLLQIAGAVAARGERALVVSAEESIEQVGRRAMRLGGSIGAVSVLATTSLPGAIDAAERFAPVLLVVDSIQTVHDPEAPGTSGSVSQVRECAARLVAYAKSTGVAVVLVGHVTKEGTLAGPRVLEHLVDTVMSFEGDRHHALRVLSVSKHRFGPAGEIGLFSMTVNGLEAVDDPSALFLADRRSGIAGSIVVPVLEGQRPFLAELQALVVRSALPTPRRAAQGIVSGRLALVLAVLEQRVGYSLAALDVFASVVGGVRVSEPAADLALGLALASAVTGVALGADLVACGEVGLGGELRQVADTERRLLEAVRRGFRRAIVPSSAPEPPAGMTLVRVATLADAVGACDLGRTSLQNVF